MKKLLIVITGLFILSAAAFASDSKTMLTGGFGVNFFGYKTPYLTTGFMYQVEIKEGMALVGGVDFGIYTDTNISGDVEADFLIPLKIGVYFPFPGEKITFGFGTGLSPCFQFTNDDSDASFLMGPYVNGSMRIKVHPVMSVFLQIQQDLLFGKPDWIYTGSQIKLGISF
ncbi:MAG: hypothetical protein U9N32_03730 [Spirochaetota bacterium]|nr:hypothetical protein [Spirochaetota bacterium]